LTLVSYSTSIVIGGLRRLLLAVLMWAGVDLKYFRAETARCSFPVFLQLWSLMEQKLEEREFWFLETLENAGRCIQIERKLSVRWRITPLGGAKKANFLKNCKFERPSLTHRTSQGHQIFEFRTQLGALLVCQVWFRSLRNWGRYCALNFEKSQKKF